MNTKYPERRFPPASLIINFVLTAGVAAGMAAALLPVFA